MLGGWAEKGKKLRNADGQVQNSHGDVEHSLGNIINTIVITLHVPGGDWKYRGGGGHSVTYATV